MKQVFHKLATLIMVFVVLYSTMSFTVDMHYCGDMLINTAIFHKAKPCGMDIEDTVSCHSDIKNNCCSKKQINAQCQDGLNIYIDKFTFQQQQFVASFVLAYINLFEGFDESATLYKSYKPFLVIKQIYKLDETYLI
tara:strand:+ start:19404 stop:19814 length:411 start_codon:yes stop_codon:yes gene_type:complete